MFFEACVTCYRSLEYFDDAISIYFQPDEDVKELDKLKSKAVTDATGKLEDSLKKLHGTNPHHKSHEEKPVKVSNFSR